MWGEKSLKIMDLESELRKYKIEIRRFLKSKEIEVKENPSDYWRLSYYNGDFEIFEKHVNELVKQRERDYVKEVVREVLSADQKGVGPTEEKQCCLPNCPCRRKAK